LLAQLRDIHGFQLACLIDAETGTVLGSVQDRGDLRLPVAAAGATDVVGVLSLMSGSLATDGELEDVIVTFSNYYHLIRLLPPSPAGRLILLVSLDRMDANLAMAHREIREFAASLQG